MSISNTVFSLGETLKQTEQKHPLLPIDIHQQALYTKEPKNWIPLYLRLDSRDVVNPSSVGPIVILA